MGPKEKQPPLPGYRFMDLPATHRYTWKIHLECNYFQSLEGDIDTSHANFLHSTLGDQANNPRIAVSGSGFNIGSGSAIVIGLFTFGYIDGQFGIRRSIISLIAFFFLGLLWLYLTYRKDQHHQKAATA